MTTSSVAIINNDRIINDGNSGITEKQADILVSENFNNCLTEHEGFGDMQSMRNLKGFNPSHSLLR